MRAWVVSLCLCAATLIAAPAASADVNDSSNWSGYAVHGASFHRVFGAWRQPKLSCAPGRETYSAYWVGLGGYSGQALEQIGTEADCGLDGRARLSAWYELVPAPSMPVSMAVAPGDAMQAEVTVSRHVVSMWLDDLTRRRRVAISAASPAIDVSSAEWIVEAPSDCGRSCQTLPLADFGTAVFTSARAQGAGGRWGTISSRAWSATRIRLTPSTRQLALRSGGAGSAGIGGFALPSALFSGGSAFRVSYSGTAASERYYGPAHPAVRVRVSTAPLHRSR